MIYRKRLELPRHIYPADQWKMVEKQFYPKLLGQTETIFSTSNGYLGIRGVFEEGIPSHDNGTFINGFYESWPITYGEEAYGFAKTGQTIVNVTDSKIIKLYVDDEPFYLPTANLLKFERTLDMKSGTLEREVIWELASGKQVSIKSTRIVSFEHRHLAAISYSVTVLNAKAPVVITSEIINNGNGAKNNLEKDEDPRRARRFDQKILQPEMHYVKDTRLVLCHSTRNSKLSLAAGIEHKLETDCSYSYISECSEDKGKVQYMVDARPGKPINLTKYMAYHTTRTAPHTSEELCNRAKRALSRARKFGFDDLLRGQKKYLNDFWKKSDVKITLSPNFTKFTTTEIQQAIRFNIFQICQATARVEGAGVPSKGLTGQAYEGHYFWDMEIYLLPFLTYTNPSIAKSLLTFRYSMLDKAREYARRLNQKGAMFPWRTINGEEASAYYAAGTAQYHINADIMFALKKYVNTTGDYDFLYEYGAEMLVETARLWSDLGFYSKNKGGKFCIHGVTGPDEYNTVVNNNLYTNLMAQENLTFAINTIESMKKAKPELFEDLVHKTKLKSSEIEAWKKASENMYIPYDKKRKIHPQDDEFLNKEEWDFKNTPSDKYPLLLHFHPLVIYRHQVIKQADVVLALFLLNNKFTDEEIKRNFDYYDPRTTGDSSLSVCIQSIVASKVGYMDKAVHYARNAALMDLADLGGNVNDGCHIASMGGTWMVFTFGFAGMKGNGGRLSFNPNLPTHVEKLKFPITYRGSIIEVEIGRKNIAYKLVSGKEAVILHDNKEIKLTTLKPATKKTLKSIKSK